MKEQLRIAIIEDDLIIAEHISLLLQKEGYPEPAIAASYSEALSLIESFKPDILLTDISLGEEKSGIELAEYVNQHFKIPVIYITSLHSAEIVKKAAQTQPAAYLIKPCKKEDLMVAMELALVAREQKKSYELSDQVITVKDGSVHVRIPFENIVLLKAEENYTAIYTSTQRPRMVRHFLGDLQSQLPNEDFIRIHRSYVVNKKYISEIHSSHVVIQNFQLPVSRSYRNVISMLKEL